MILFFVIIRTILLEITNLMFTVHLATQMARNSFDKIGSISTKMQIKVRAKRYKHS